MKNLAVVLILCVLLAGCASGLSRKDAIDAAYLQGYLDGMKLAEETIEGSGPAIKKAWTKERLDADITAARAKIDSMQYPRH